MSNLGAIWHLISFLCIRPYRGTAALAGDANRKFEGLASKTLATQPLSPPVSTLSLGGHCLRQSESGIVSESQALRSQCAKCCAVIVEVKQSVSILTKT